MAIFNSKLFVYQRVLMIKNVGEVIFKIFGHNASLYGDQHLDEEPHEMGGFYGIHIHLATSKGTHTSSNKTKNCFGFIYK